MAGLPPGRSSSVKTTNKTFILQTEFRTVPKTAIVTSVTLDGQVVHKVERSYAKPWEAEEDFKAAETAINSQHMGMEKKIKINANDFIRQTASIKISRVDRLGVIPGVSFVAPLDEKLASDNPAPIYIQSKLILDIADSVSESSRSGKFKIAAIVNEQGKYLVDRDETRGYLVSLRPDVEMAKVLKEVMEG
ncbi:MAG: hypothetical protein V3W18_01450 [candidate division Zixibacteria bacterium]